MAARRTHRTLGAISMVALAFACTHDFNRFHEGAGGASSGGSAASTNGGSAGASTTGGSAGSTSSGGATTGGTGGTGASAGTVSGGSGGTGGTAGSSSGGSAGQPPTCTGSDVDCGGTCVDPSTSAAHCGSCANSCTLQGKSTGFFCQASSCWCTGSTQCRGGGTTGGVVACNTATGQCECGTTGNYCNHGEVCLKSGSVQVCTCNGQTACPAGQTCCYSPSGCKDVQNDAANCGACGHVCTGGTCQNGQCI